MGDPPNASAPVKARKAPLTAGRLDTFERALVALVYLALVGRILISVASGGELANLLLLPSEGLVVVFLLLRRRTHHISQRWSDWGLALAATLGPMLVAPGIDQPLIPASVGAVILLAGTFIQLHAKLVLARSFGCVPAHRGLKTAGPYRFVRHPMYAGYLLGHVAFLAMNPTLWNLAIYAVCNLLQVGRLLAEERFLGTDPEYRRYCRQTPYRLIPLLF